MSTVFGRLRVSLALAGLAALLGGPAAWAAHDPTLTLASGSAAVTVSGSGISDTPGATTCTATPGGWAAPVGGSQWISSHADCAVGVDTADFTYTTAFTLPGDLSGQGVSLSGSVLADDGVTVWLNGVNAHQLFAGGGAGAVGTFSTGDATLFRGGQNTLQFVVHNSGGGASGLDFVVTVTAPGAAPAPGAARGTHGACVSAVAHQHTPGERHGAAVSQAAHSCPH